MADPQPTKLFALAKVLHVFLQLTQREYRYSTMPVFSVLQKWFYRKGAESSHMYFNRAAVVTTQSIILLQHIGIHLQLTSLLAD